MALANLLNLRQTVLKRDGTVNRGGQIDVFEPGTAVRITTFSDSALTNQNTNPVVLSAGGQANIWLSRDCDLDVFDLDGNIISSEQNVNPEQLGVSEASGLVPNGSFEIDTDQNDEPDGWTRTDESGSTNTLDDTQSSDGAQSMQFISTGAGGGNIITDDFFVVNDVDDLSVEFDIKSSVVNVRNIVRIEWFDASQVSISNDDVYDNASTNPLVFTTQATQTTPPANARFAKLRMIGCDPSDSTPGNTNFDRVSVFFPLIVIGAFGNLLLQANEIISTDVDGNVEINPNGVGEPQLKFNALVRVVADAVAVRLNRDFTGADSQVFNEAAAGFDARSIQLADAGGIALDVLESSGLMRLLQTDTAGVPEKNVANFVRDGRFELFVNNVMTHRGLTAALGGAEVENSLTGVGFRRVLTEGDALTDEVESDIAIPGVAFVTGLSIRGEINRTYAITGFLMTSVALDADDSTTRIRGPAGMTAIVQLSGVANGPVTFRVDETQATLMDEPGGGTISSVFISGSVIMGGTPGAVTVEVAKQADAGGDGTIHLSSWLKMVPVPSAP